MSLLFCQPRGKGAYGTRSIEMYFCLTRRAVTIIVDVPNEDAMFEALFRTWVATKSYPDVWPVVGAAEFPSLLQRAGVTP